MGKDKAQGAGNGPSLFKHCNAVFAHELGSPLVNFLWASHKGLIHVVATLANRTTITRELRLVAKPFVTRCIHQNYVVGVLPPSTRSQQIH